jgi:hypothetical protein
MRSASLEIGYSDYTGTQRSSGLNCNSLYLGGTYDSQTNFISSPKGRISTSTGYCSIWGEEGLNLAAGYSEKGETITLTGSDIILNINGKTLKVSDLC